MRERVFFARRDLLFFALLFVLCAAAFLFVSLAPGGTTAVVEQNGKVVLTRDLSQLTEPEVFRLSGENGITLSIRLTRDGAEVESANCPDRTCVRTGKLTRAGEAALCLPAKISVRLTSGENAADAATY